MNKKIDKPRFDQVDALLGQWVCKHNLRLVKAFKDYEVRSIPIYSVSGEMIGQIWLQPTHTDNWLVHLAISVDGKEEKCSRETAIEGLYNTLEDLWVDVALEKRQDI